MLILEIREFLLCLLLAIIGVAKFDKLSSDY